MPNVIHHMMLFDSTFHNLSINTLLPGRLHVIAGLAFMADLDCGSKPFIDWQYP